MASLKLLLHLNARYPRILSTCYLVNSPIISGKLHRFISTCGSLHNRRSQQKQATAEDNSEDFSAALDYFGVDHNLGLLDHERALAKQAWLESLEKSTPENSEGAAKADKSTSTDRSKDAAMVAEVDRYHSDVVKRLVSAALEEEKQSEHIVSKHFGTVRYDVRKPDNPDVKKKKKPKKEVKSHRFENIVGKSLRQSIRGKTNEVLKAVNSSGINDFSDSIPVDNHRFENISGKSLRRSIRGKTNEVLKAVNSSGINVFSDSIPEVKKVEVIDQETGSSYIDDQYFQKYNKLADNVDSKSKTNVLNVDTQTEATVNNISAQEKFYSKSQKVSEEIVRDYNEENKQSDLSYIDKQYFVNQTEAKTYSKKAENSSFETKVDTLKKSFETDFIIEDQYFHVNKSELVNFQMPDAHVESGTSGTGIESNKKKAGKQKPTRKESRPLGTSAPDQSQQQQHFGADFIDEQYFGYKDKLRKDTTAQFKEENVPVVVNKIDHRSGNREKLDKKKKVEKVSEKEDQKAESAYEVAMQARAELDSLKGRRLYGKMNVKAVDSKGYRIVKEQVPDFSHVPASDIADLLRKNIIYDYNDIVAINKPYGLCSQGGPGVRTSVEQLLPDILPSSKLYLISKLDKSTTGVMLLAKTPEMATKLQTAFMENTPIKRYLVVTKNIPKLPSGEINIPIADGEVNGKVRKTLKPYGNAEMKIPSKLSADADRAITRYRVLNHQKSCAILECVPLTSVKHQIRVHLAFGLNCPILGDHKYSHFDKIAPMKIHSDMLDRLRIRQSKVRHVAMHLHARSVVIPEFLDGQNFFVSAPLPSHFVKNIKQLKLKLPPKQ